MSIEGSWPIKNNVDLPERFVHPLITSNESVVITDLGAGKAKVDVYDSEGRLYMSGDEVLFDNATRKEAIHGKIKILANNTYCYISAYSRFAIDYEYIFGVAMTKKSADDSGGQWDGNRPR